MWTRAELKDRAKSALHRNYWKVVVVGLISAFWAGFTTSVDFSNVIDSIDFELTPELAIIVLIAALILLIISIISCVVAVFVFSPLEVGISRFFLSSLSQDPDFREVAFAYESGYINVVKILFVRNLKTFLWMMLFIVPGIVKSYEYRMIPYLLAENPDLTMDEAFRLSRQMMTGQKWETFVLDWSFFGWQLLILFTCGILGTFYVQPYVYLTNAALFEKLNVINGYPARAVAIASYMNYQYVQPEYEPVYEETEEEIKEEI